MHIIIDVPEEYYATLQGISDDKLMIDTFLIKHGTPLPKGHGRIIDESQITQVCYYDYISKVDGWHIPHCFIDGTDAPTIVGADTESEDKE